MVTRQELDDLDLGTVRSVAEGWGDLMGAAHAAGDDVDRSVMRRITGTQKGATANALTGRLSVLRDNYTYVAEESGLIGDTLSALADELADAQVQLRDALRRVEGMPGFRVEADGSISYPLDGPHGGRNAGGPKPSGGAALPAGRGVYSAQDELPSAKPPFEPNGAVVLDAPESPNRRAAKNVFGAIDAAVRQATRTDEKFTAVLRKFTAQHDYRVTDATWRNVAADDKAAVAADGDDLKLDSVPARSADPKAVAEWWKGLSPQERQELLALAPDRIGRLDGLPADVRDQANRTCLPMLIARYEGDGDQGDAFQKLAGFTSISTRLDSEMGGPVPVYLLDIGDEGQGRATLSVGDPDTAQNVSAFVPGLNTRLSDLGDGDFLRAKNVWVAANKADPTQSTASIVTLGYDTPQVGTSDVLNDPAVMGTTRADQGAANYDRLLDGIHAAHRGAAPHVTAIGHSYGSLVVGRAATRPGGVPADDVVLIGSPGVGVQHAGQLGVGAQHVYVGAAESDPISHMPSHAVSESLLRVPLEAATGDVVGAGVDVGTAIGDHVADPHELWFGQDPASAGFGAQRFAVSPQGDVFTAQAHSNNYLEAEPTAAKSLSNIGRIVTGHGALITRQAYR